MFEKNKSGFLIGLFVIIFIQNAILNQMGSGPMSIIDIISQVLGGYTFVIVIGVIPAFIVSFIHRIKRKEKSKEKIIHSSLFWKLFFYISVLFYLFALCGTIYNISQK